MYRVRSSVKSSNGGPGAAPFWGERLPLGARFARNRWRKPWKCSWPAPSTLGCRGTIRGARRLPRWRGRDQRRPPTRSKGTPNPRDRSEEDRDDPPSKGLRSPLSSAAADVTNCSANLCSVVPSGSGPFLTILGFEIVSNLQCDLMTGHPVDCFHADDATTKLVLDEM